MHSCGICWHTQPCRSCRQRRGRGSVEPAAHCSTCAVLKLLLHALARLAASLLRSAAGKRFGRAHRACNCTSVVCSPGNRDQKRR